MSAVQIARVGEQPEKAPAIQQVGRLSVVRQPQPPSGDVVQATTSDDSNRNGCSLAALVEEAKRVHAALGQLLAEVDRPAPAVKAPQVMEEGQPYPFKSRPQKMAPAAFKFRSRQLQAGLDEGLLKGQVMREWEKFKDHTFAAVRQDWDATWRNWIRTSADRLPRLGRQGPAVVRRPVVQEAPEEAANPAEAMVSIRGIIDKLTGGRSR